MDLSWEKGTNKMVMVVAIGWITVLPTQSGSEQPAALHTVQLPTPCTVFQVPVQSWFDDMTDTELLDLIPFFEGLSREDDVYSMLHRLCNR